MTVYSSYFSSPCLLSEVAILAMIILIIEVLNRAAMEVANQVPRFFSQKPSFRSSFLVKLAVGARIVHCCSLIYPKILSFFVLVVVIISLSVCRSTCAEQGILGIQR